MRTPVRLGVTDGAIDVTSAAVGKSGENRFHCVEVKLKSVTMEAATQNWP
jgi:hypothetical protein